MPPRHPEIHVATASRNPLALVAAIREGLRRARADAEEIRRFSGEALAARDACGIRAVCRNWAVVQDGSRDASPPDPGA